MKKYARLALLLLVLTLSVGMLSTAINILGDITRLDLDEDQPPPAMSMAAPGLEQAQEEVQVGEMQTGKRGPIIEIRLAPRTRYIRRYPMEDYDAGKWYPIKEKQGEQYNGTKIPSVEGSPRPQSEWQFYIKPIAKFSGWLPVAPNTMVVNSNLSLQYYPELQSFDSNQYYNTSYWVGARIYQHSDALLRSKRAIGSENQYIISEKLEANLRTLGEEIIEGQLTDYDKYKAIETHLTENYEFSDQFTNPPTSLDPISWFLFNDRKGTGSHFNTAFVLLSRSIGLPARVVVGFLIDPFAEFQYVLSQQAYMYAEVNFEDLGYVIFDATPIQYRDNWVNKTIQPTITNITGNDPIAIKGKQFNVWGTVQLFNGSGVSDTQVEIILKEDKEDLNETGLIVGVGFTENGWFNVTSDAPLDMNVGDYNLIAHNLETRYYEESWSDPPIRVMAETNVRISGSSRVYSGKNITYRGYVIDASTEKPLRNATLVAKFGNDQVEMKTDWQGKIVFDALFPENGFTNLTIEMMESRYFLGSHTAFAVTVIPQPPEVDSIIAFLFSFPNNIIIAVASAVGVSAYAARRSRRLQQEEVQEPRVRLPPEKEDIGYEDNVPLTYSSYEEGVVKLFNRFYVSMQRIYPDIDDAWTPREFEYNLMERLPGNSHAALEDLITSYEVAMYSNISLSQEDFKRTNATIELIIELMRNVPRE